MSQSSFGGFTLPRPDRGGTNTGDANATAADILPGKTAYAKGVKLTGTATSDANATAADIASGKTAYVNGAKLTGSNTAGAALGTGTSNATGNFVVTGLTFAPTRIVITYNDGVTYRHQTWGFVGLSGGNLAYYESANAPQTGGFSCSPSGNGFTAQTPVNNTQINWYAYKE